MYRYCYVPGGRNSLPAGFSNISCVGVLSYNNNNNKYDYVRTTTVTVGGGIYRSIICQLHHLHDYLLMSSGLQVACFKWPVNYVEEEYFLNVEEEYFLTIEKFLENF